MTCPSLFVVSGPSGVGKTSLVSALTEALPQITCPVSYTTRAPRPGERDGIDYYFVSTEQFDDMVAQESFIEHARVFGNFYGTSRHTVENHLQQGETLLLEIDWQGAAQARKLFPEVITVMILPPSISNLRERLDQRQQNADGEIEQRMLAATNELGHFAEFDYLIINDNFETALEELRSVIVAGGLRHSVQREKIAQLLPELDPASPGHRRDPLT